MYKLFFILWIWINLFGEVKPVKPIFDLANNMRLVSFSNSIKKPSHVTNDCVKKDLYETIIQAYIFEDWDPIDRQKDSSNM